MYIKKEKAVSANALDMYDNSSCCFVMLIFVGLIYVFIIIFLGYKMDDKIIIYLIKQFKDFLLLIIV